MVEPNKNETAVALNLPQAIVRELGDLAVIDMRNSRAVLVSAEAANTATRAAQIAEGYDVDDLRVQQ